MNNTVSIAKGIGILLMVLGHAGCPENIHSFIYLFHMPLFFILSGYCFNNKYLEKGGEKDFIIKRIKGLYIPFIKYQIIFLLLHNLFFYFNIYNDVYGFNGTVSHLYTLKETLIRGFRIVTSMQLGEQLLGGYWFLRELLYASFISLLAIRYIKNTYYAIIAMLGISFLALFFNLKLPYLGIRSISFLGAAFFITGYQFKKQNIKRIYSIWSIVILFLVTFIGSLFLSSTMLSYNLIEFPFYYIGAVFGSLFILAISYQITRIHFFSFLVKYFVWIGNNTLTVLTWHFLYFKLVSLFIIWTHGLPIRTLAQFPVIQEYEGNYWTVYFIIGSFLPLGVKYLYQKRKNNYTNKENAQ